MATRINRFTGFPVTSPARLTLGLLVNIGGLLALATLVLGQALHDAQVREAMLASLAAGAATGLGALVLLMIRRPDSARLERFMVLAAGMMLAAAIFSLLVPAFGFSTRLAALDVFAAIAAGWWLMRVLDRRLPHRHPGDASAGAPGHPAAGRPAGAVQTRTTLQLVVIAIAAHNVPEGFAVGAGFGGGSGFGWATAVSIGAQNIPEGLIVATALWTLGLRRRAAALGALATGLIEPLGAAVGIAASAISAATLPIALGLAGGAMLFVVIDELAPTAWRRGSHPAELARSALYFVAGFAVMAATGLVAVSG